MMKSFIILILFSLMFGDCKCKKIEYGYIYNPSTNRWDFGRKDNLALKYNKTNNKWSWEYDEKQYQR